MSDINLFYFKEIIREPKVFKPLAIPRKLQEALPYRDKPKLGVKLSEKKKEITRPAVIKEPYEQKVHLIHYTGLQLNNRLFTG